MTVENAAPAAPKTDSDYINAVLTAAEAGETAAPPAAAVEAVAPAAPKAEEPAPPPKEEEPSVTAKTFEQLAKKKDEIRKEAESLAHLKELQKAAQSRDLRKIAEAHGIELKSPLEALKAAGFTWEDAIEFAASGKLEKEKAPPPPANPEIAELKAQLQQLQMQKFEGDTTATIDKALTDDKFAVLRDLDVDAKQVYNQLMQYGNQFGEWPVPGDLKASITLVLEAQVENAKKMAEKFGKVQSRLTSKKAPGTVPPVEVAGAAESGQAKQFTTLTNAMDGAPAPRATTLPRPKSDDDYVKRVLAEIG